MDKPRMAFLGAPLHASAELQRWRVQFWVEMAPEL